MVGVIAEFYLLMVNNYFVKGGVGQVLTMMSVLKALGIIGAAAFGAGLVMWIMRKSGRASRLPRRGSCARVSSLRCPLS